jgi:large subunit ribosomal protein L24
MPVKFKIKKGDKVIVIAGKDKGKQGDVMQIITDENRAIVSGVNVAKRHTKAQGATEGGIINKLLPIHISNLALRRMARRPA